MNRVIVQSLEAVTLVGGGPVSASVLRLALARAPRLVAADGGADRALALGHEPEVAIGDFDSISGSARARMGAARMHEVAEQETTDFDKALRSVNAPFVLAVGVLGARVDHQLAVLNVLVRRQGPPCVLIGAHDVVFAAPKGVTLDLACRKGDRLSLFPMAPVRGHSDGLEWPISGIAFDPAGAIGTSNRVVAPRVLLRFDAAGMLVICPRGRLDAVLAALL